MSEYITHTAVVDDCLRLMAASDRFCDAFKTAADQHHDMVHLGCATRGGDPCNPGLMTTFRDNWANRTPDQHLEPKLAFVLGWLCHRAADRQMKPVFRRFHPPGTRKEKPTECSVSHDAFAFRAVYAGGEEPPYHPAMFGEQFAALADAANVAGMGDLVRVLLRRALIEMHTLIPDLDDPEGWIDAIYTRKQAFYVDLERYEAAINSPDPDKAQRYIIEDNFYNGDEPLIRVARALQHGEDVTQAEVNEALTSAGDSHYGQALAIGMRYLQAADAYFLGEIDIDRLRERWDIGKPGVDGLPV